jgi:hypothetical protein
MEQLDEVVEEIRKLMLDSVEGLFSMRKLGNRKPASTKKRRWFKPFHKAKGKVIEELSQV